MDNQTRPSFIPRRSPTAPKKQRSSRSIGLFGYLSYILFIGSIMLSVGMFVVSEQVQSTLQDRQTELANISNQFQQSEMDRVQEYEQFLNQLSGVFNRSISVQPLFAAIEGSIAETVVMADINLERTTDSLTLESSVQADSFDSALFQRNVYEEFPVLATFTLQDVVLLSAGQRIAANRTDEDDDPVILTSSGSDIVNFLLTFDLSADTLPFSPQVVPAEGDVDNEPINSAATTNDLDT